MDDEDDEDDEGDDNGSEGAITSSQPGGNSSSSSTTTTTTRARPLASTLTDEQLLALCSASSDIFTMAAKESTARVRVAVTYGALRGCSMWL